MKEATQWLQCNRFQAVGVLSVLLLVGVTLPAHAAEVTDLLISATGTLFDILLSFFVVILNIIGYAIGKLIVLMLGMVIIPILGYNGFADSNIIAIGWPLVRDVVNMFVIIILLVIAMRTIIGYKEANWQQQLPRLFIAIIAVNFSKTITLLVVDIGQVVMMTFVNALRDIAAGNFVSMFRLTSFFEYNVDNIENLISGEPSAVPFEGVGYLATSYVTVVFLLAVLAVLCILAVVFIYRIIIIWVLTIMSPMAFFLGGIKSTVPRAGSPYSQWWEKLIGAVALGPILTFFLWLALAAASEGSLAQSEGFPSEGTDDIPSLLSEVFHIEELLSLFIALILIMVGFQAASQSASALGGFSGKLINEGTGKALVKNAAKLPASVAYRGARAGGRVGMAAGRLGARGAKAGGIELARQLEARTGVGSSIGKDIQTFGGRLEAEGGFLGRTAGRLVRGAGGRLQGTAEASVAEGRKVASERAAGKTKRERVGDLMNIDDPSKLLLQGDRFEQEANLKELLTNKDMRAELSDVAEDRAKREALSRQDQFANEDEQKEWESQRKNEIVDKKMDQAFTWAESKEGKALMADKKDELKKARAGNLRSLGDSSKISDFLTEMGDDFKISMLSKEDMQNSEVLKALSGHTMREYTDRFGNVIKESALDQAAGGKGGVDTKVKNLAQGSGAKFDDLLKYAGQEEDEDGSVRRDAAGNPIRKTVDGSILVAQAIKNNKLKLSELTVDHLSARDADGNVIQDAAGNNEMDDNKIAALAEAITESKSDAGDLMQNAHLDDAVKQRILGVMRGRAQEASVAGDEEQLKKYRKALLSASDHSERAITGIGADGTLPTTEIRKVVNEFVVEQPSAIGSLQDSIGPTGGPANDVTDAIVRNVNQQTLKNMQNLLNQAINEGNNDLADRIRQSASTIAQASEKEMGRNGANTEQMRREARRYGQVGRYTVT